MDPIERFRGCLLGLAAGDALGTALEFKPRGSFTPLIDMIGGGPFRLAPGQWTDDTSMALCLATSLVETEGFQPRDQMERYCRWRHEGYLSSNGDCFDIGNTVASALMSFEQSGEPWSGSTHPHSAGNGCIMRLAPVPMYYHPDLARAVEMSGESSRTTHGARECVDASRMFGGMLHKALDGCDKEAILAEPHLPRDTAPVESAKLQAISAGVYRDQPEDAIRGSGYVVASLEAALWCFARTDSYRDAVLAAANLGDDADTTAAVCGQIAGAYYGDGGIPAAWLDVLAERELITELADRLREATP